MRLIFIAILTAPILGNAALLAQAQAQTNTTFKPKVQAQTNTTPALKAQVETNTTFELKLDDQTRALLRAAAEDTWLKKETFASTLFGGILAIAGGFAASWYAQKLEASYKRKQEAEFCKNLLRAIRCEVEALHRIYDGGIGKRVKESKEGDMFLFRLGLTEDWFTVFESNAGHIGRIEGAVSIQIVTVYAHMKRLIEEFRLNNGYLNELDDAYNQLKVKPFETVRKQQIEKYLQFQAGKIKEADQSLKTEAARLMAMFDEKRIN